MRGQVYLFIREDGSLERVVRLLPIDDQADPRWADQYLDAHPDLSKLLSTAAVTVLDEEDKTHG